MGSTHSLEGVKVATSQEAERKQASKWHSLAGEGRGGDLEGHRKKANHSGALTSWREQRLGMVRTVKDKKPSRATHFLERAEVRNSQEVERKPASNLHSLPG